MGSRHLRRAQLSAAPSRLDSQQASRKRRRQAYPQRRSRRKESLRILAFEHAAKLAVNSILAIAAVVALVRLVSYNAAQQDKLAQLEAEVQASQTQLEAEREDFQHYFDPQQARLIMREQSYRVVPGQAQIIFDEPESMRATSSSSAESDNSTTNAPPPAIQSTDTPSTDTSLAVPPQVESSPRPSADETSQRSLRSRSGQVSHIDLEPAANSSISSPSTIRDTTR